MKPIRTHGIYEIHGHDGKDEPFWMVPDKLDTSMSLGTGLMGTDEWKPGLRKNNRLIEAQIAIYAERWGNKNDLPKPTILVLGEGVGNGVYRPTLTVVDGAMWVAAAKEAGRERIPVHVVVPINGQLKIDKRAMWLYFNTITNGLAPTEKERNSILVDLALYARNQCGVTDAFVTVGGARVRSYVQWATEYSLATAVSVSTIVEVVKGKFATQRSKAQLQQDREDLASGKKTVADIRKATNKSATAIRRDARRANVQITPTGGKKRAQKPQADLGAIAAAAEENAREAADPKVANAAQYLRSTLALLFPAIHEIISQSEKLTNPPSLNGASPAQRLSVAEAHEFWAGTPDLLWKELARLVNNLRVYTDLEMARSGAPLIIPMARTIMDTLVRYNDPLVKKLALMQAAEQMSLSEVAQ